MGRLRDEITVVAPKDIRHFVGVVMAGESYEESAARELFEELGIRASLTFHFDYFHNDAENRVWGRVFSCVHDGPMALQVEEVESGEFRAVDEVLAMSCNTPFTPDGIKILKNCLTGKRLPVKESLKKKQKENG